MLKLTTTPFFADPCGKILHEGEHIQMAKRGSKSSLFASSLRPCVKSPHSGQATLPTSLVQTLLRKRHISQAPVHAARLHQDAAAHDDTAVFAALRP